MDERIGRRAVVLLIEDDPGDQELTRRALMEDVVKTDLHVVCDGAEAMEFLLQEGAYDADTAPRPDLVLLDLNMPKIDGRQVLERVRANAGLQSIPVIVLTTSRQEEDIIRSYNLGCNSFITKPVDMGDFIKVIRELGHYWFELVTLPAEVGV